MATVDRQLGAIARPGAVHFVTLLPKTRSGKLLRRTIQALAERRDPGDTSSRAALMLRWLHRNGHLRYLYMRFDKPA